MNSLADRLLVFPAFWLTCLLGSFLGWGSFPDPGVTVRGGACKAGALSRSGSLCGRLLRWQSSSHFGQRLPRHAGGACWGVGSSGLQEDGSPLPCTGTAHVCTAVLWQHPPPQAHSALHHLAPGGHCPRLSQSQVHVALQLCTHTTHIHTHAHSHPHNHTGARSAHTYPFPRRPHAYSQKHP